MRILLDTHVFLWMQTAPEQFSDQALEILENAGHELLLSAASSWEIAIKYGLGRLPLPSDPAEYVPNRMIASNVSALDVLHRHALGVARLAAHHRDPFDRLLVAQAEAESVPIMTADPAFAPYDVDVIPAR